MQKKKVLLMGWHGSGKTSMRVVVFADYKPQHTRQLSPTNDVERCSISLLGHLKIDMWDCGGQETSLDHYYSNHRTEIFVNVDVLVYVFDVQSSGKELQKYLRYYDKCLSLVHQHSPYAKVFCILHKMDLFEGDKNKELISDTESIIIERSKLFKPFEITFLKTSIYNESVYQGWSTIMKHLVPIAKELERSLKTFGDCMDCVEVLLLDRFTLLSLSNYESTEDLDPNRFEKITQVLKKFKLTLKSCTKAFETIEVRNSQFCLFIAPLTNSTFILAVMSDPFPCSALFLMNVKNAKKHFEEIECKMKCEVNTPKAESTNSDFCSILNKK